VGTITRVLLAALLPMSLVACTTGEQPPTSATRSGASADVAPGSDLRTFRRVLAELERAYVDRPDFATVAIGAMQAIEQAATEARLRVTESEQETRVSYHTAAGEDQTIAFRRQLTQEQAVADVAVLFRVTREAAPAVAALTLERALIVGALRRLDPDSSYLEPETYGEMQREVAGNFGAAGLELTLRDGPLTVVSPIDDWPAARAGVQAGDRLERIDGSATQGLSLPEVVKRLRGRPGTTVTLTVAREEWSEPREIRIVREQLRVTSVVSRPLAGGVTYVKVRNLQESTAPDLDRVLATAARARTRAMILDLRNNPGGLLTAAVEVAERFLEAGQLVTYTEGRLRNQNLRFSARARKAYTAMPMVALVNQGSAAGAEIIAGALQDWRRASLVGVPTFGRGSIQTIIPLGEGSGLRLTTARWFTPKGRQVHGNGLTPDQPVEGRGIPPLTPGMTEEEWLARDVQLRSALARLGPPTEPQPGR